MKYDNWNIDIYYQEKMWEVDDVENAEVIENGPVRGCLRIRRRFLDSVITQDMIIYNDIPRIDFKTELTGMKIKFSLKQIFRWMFMQIRQSMKFNLAMWKGRLTKILLGYCQIRSLRSEMGRSV